MGLGAQLNKPAKNTRKLSLGLALVGALMFSALTAVGVDLVFCSIRLRESGYETAARVVEVGPGGYRGHWVRYEFAVDGDKHTYSATDALRLRRGIGAKVSPGEREKALHSGTILVRYLPSNPWINLPANAPPFSENLWVSGVATGLLGLFALLSWVAFIAAVMVRRRRNAVTFG